MYSIYTYVHAYIHWWIHICTCTYIQYIRMCHISQYIASLVAPVEFFEEFSDLMATNGSSVAFVCSVRGSKPITYQWLKDGTLLPLEDNSTLEINPVLFGDEGSYQCNASNIFNSIAADAILTGLL